MRMCVVGSFPRPTHRCSRPDSRTQIAEECSVSCDTESFLSYMNLWNGKFQTESSKTWIKILTMGLLIARGEENAKYLTQIETSFVSVILIFGKNIVLQILCLSWIFNLSVVLSLTFSPSFSFYIICSK